MNPFPRTWVEIDLPALAHNLSVVREALGPEPPAIGLVVKADAYGHGLVQVTRHALRHGARWAMVATVQEGIALRDAGVDAPVLVMSPILEVEAEQAVFYRLKVTLDRIEIAQALSQAAERQETIAEIHLKIDTGMSRFGVLPDEAADAARTIAGLPALTLEGVATHFAGEQSWAVQLKRFHSALASVREAGVDPLWTHCANSTAAVRLPNVGNLVRLGAVAYGLDPRGLFPAGALRPVLTWKARITAIRSRATGTLVSYGGTWRAPRPTRIATLGVGYGDGYPRTLSNRGVVEVRGHEAPVIGLVNMDQVMLDVTGVPGVEVGDEALLIGGAVSVERLMRLNHSNAQSIVAQIMPRVPRRYTHA